jgi:hypothetical protein
LTDVPEVTSIVVDRCAGVVLAFEDHFAIEVFPDASSSPHSIDREQWRLLHPGQETPHFVLLNGGIE